MMGGRRPVIRLTDKQSQKKQELFGLQFKSDFFNKQVHMELDIPWFLQI